MTRPTDARALREAPRGYRRYTQADMDAAVQEAFMVGRIYAARGEKESPREIQLKLHISAQRAIVISRRSRREANRGR